MWNLYDKSVMVGLKLLSVVVYWEYISCR